MKHLEIALAEYGNKGFEGPVHNPDVQKYFSETGFKWIADDETAWCAAFLNWVLLNAGLPSSRSLLARSFLEIGTKIEKPEIGDLVVLWRVNPKSGYGHAGIFIREHAGLIFILGGNQQNSVNISAYPKTQLLGYRRVLIT